MRRYCGNLICRISMGYVELVSLLWICADFLFIALYWDYEDEAVE